MVRQTKKKKKKVLSKMIDLKFRTLERNRLGEAKWYRLAS